MNMTSSGGSKLKSASMLRNHRTDDAIDIAVRVYPDSTSLDDEETQSTEGWRRPKAMFVFDTETRTDATQSLLFGSFRFIVEGKCVQEALFHAYDLSPQEQQELKRYVDHHRADT